MRTDPGRLGMIHPDQGLRLGEIFESHQLDGIAHDFYLGELKRERKSKEDSKGRLFSGVLRTGNWDEAQLKELSERYGADYGHTSKSLGRLFIWQPAGAFERLEASEARRELDGGLLGVLQTALLGAQMGNKPLWQRPWMWLLIQHEPLKMQPFLWNH